MSGAMSPADVMALAKEQEERAIKILNGKLPPPNPLVKEFVTEFSNIQHDLEIMHITKRKLESNLEQVTRDIAKLEGAADNCKRNVTKMEWLFSMELERVNKDGKPEKDGKPA